MTGQQHVIVQCDDRILVTGASGFIGAKVVDTLLHRGFNNLRCLVRSARGVRRLEAVIETHDAKTRVDVVFGNLVSRADCASVAKDVALIYHLAGGSGEKAVADAFLNSAVATRNLLAATLEQDCLQRFVNTSSFSVYDIARIRDGVLDESCPMDLRPQDGGDAYEFAKVKQDEIVAEYAQKYGISVVTVRPGYVYGPGKGAISGRVGVGTFGLFLHLGGSNAIPFTYLDNCAGAIVLAGLTPGIEGEVFNVVDDELPSSRTFLRLYKNNVRRFRSLYLPSVVSYVFCSLWERYSFWSQQQLPPAFTRKKWYKYWKNTRYSNAKLKARLGWYPEVPMMEGLRRYFESCRAGERRA